MDHDHRVGRVGAFRGLGGAIRASAPRRAPRAPRRSSPSAPVGFGCTGSSTPRVTALAAVGWLSRIPPQTRTWARTRTSAAITRGSRRGDVALGAYQPLNAYLRPPNPTPQELAGGKSAPRRRWEWVHRLSGVAALIASVVAVTTGSDRYVWWGAAGEAGRAGVRRGGWAP